jgi:hypothetical protein
MASKSSLVSFTLARPTPDDIVALFEQIKGRKATAAAVVEEMATAASRSRMVS